MEFHVQTDLALDKAALEAEVAAQIGAENFSIVERDFSRPWGGFFVLDERDIRRFHARFFAELALSEEQFAEKLSPKILCVAPGKRLSWQYHHRRAEVWKLVAGQGAIVRSADDAEGPEEDLALGKYVSLDQGERHRLVGKPEGWGIVAEIWMHTDPENPSDESDIVRVTDDFKRS
ncbi:MAG: phosphoheptose isomerase [Nitritalea sp.]